MSKLVPKLRFKEFSGEWEKKRLDEIIDDFIVPMRDKPKDLTGDIPWCRIEDFDGIYLSKSKSNQGVTEETVKSMNLKVYPKNTLLVSCSADLGRCAIVKNKLVTNQTFIGLKPKSTEDVRFLYYLMSYSRDRLNALSTGTTISYLSRQEFEKFEINIPSLNEQKKIAHTLSSLDALIEAQNKKVEALQKHKKALMQQMFPKKGEKTPKLRFKEFSGEWEEKKLGDCLDYLQPTKYLVSSTAYDDEYKTPVLTAGKTFILGYTDETHGIFSDDLPVIIFDDFTTATKFVDFPFKAKSSAMKILIAKEENNIKFMYEAMQMIQYEVGNHERHWISKFALLKVAIPKPKEQEKIAKCLTSLDALIEAQNKKVEALQKHKKALMQQMFVSGER